MAYRKNDIQTTTATNGDLSGTFGAPTVAKLNGVTVSGTPSTGQVLTASSGTAAAWTAAGTTFTVVAKAVSYTANAGEFIWATGTITITSPTPTANAVVSVANVGTGAVTFLPASGTVNGASSFVLTNQYDSFRFLSDGTNWIVF